jgi:hypothetical protein
MRQILIALIVSLLLGRDAFAQSSAPHGRDIEVFGNLGAGKITRFDDDTRFGGGLNIGGGAGWRPLRSLGLEVEAHGITGLDDTVTSAVALAGNALYYFPVRNTTFQPFVLGGFGTLRTRSRGLDDFGRGSLRERADTGWGINVGAGARLQMAPRWSLRPQVNYIECPWLSRENLGQVRGSIALGYHWR